MDVIAVLLISLLVAIVSFIGYRLAQRAYFKRQYRRKKRVDRRAVQVPPSRQEPLRAEYFKRNRLQILNNGESFFPLLFEKIEQARHHVHLLFYIVQDDRLAEQLFSLLEKKRAEGVEVRLLVDGVGSRKLVAGPRFKKLKQQGIACGVFAPLKWPYLPVVHFRNHRKIVVIDGKIGFTGGHNVGEEYLHRDPQKGYWRDIHLLLEGESVQDLAHLFATDWYYTTGELLTDEYFSLQPENHRPEGSLAQVIPSGPDLKRPLVKISYLKVIAAAKERLWLGTPYFIPDEALVKALIQASKNGIEIKLIVPERTDHWLVHYASLQYIKRLLEGGIQIYFYKKGFYHAKFAAVDEQYVYIGSANLDRRSLYYNFEAGVLIADQPTVRQAAGHYEQDLRDSVQLTEAQLKNRSLSQKLATQFSYLFAPWL